MTTQCKLVLDECDFPETDIKEIEIVLIEHSPAQIIHLVWSKDPKGIHDFEWFKPFFKGYVKKINKRVFEPDDAFWSAYYYLDQVVDTLSSYDMPSIYDMSREMKKLKMAVGKSRVNSVPYIYKVFKGIKLVTVETNKIDFELINYGVKTHDIS